jgi:hypothetical protein
MTRYGVEADVPPVYTPGRTTIQLEIRIGIQLREPDAISAYQFKRYLSDYSLISINKITDFSSRLTNWVHTKSLNL